jgi:hypothetical protein
MSIEGQDFRADQAISTLPSIEESGPGLSCPAVKASPGMPVSTLLNLLAEMQVHRKFYIATTNKQTNAVGALARRAIGWRYDMAEADRAKMNGRAARIVAAALNGKKQRPDDVAAAAMLSANLAVISIGIEATTKARHKLELDMKRAVRKLPIADWAKGVHGLGELGLAVILAEAGDLAKYPKKGHLWKRLGLAPLDGRAMSTWRMKGGLSAEQWTQAGYSPRRRAEIYAVISEPLFRQQTVVQGPYRAIYDRRKAATEIWRPDWTKMHRHMDALRVMTKHLIRDLWVAWRRAKCSLPERAGVPVPAAKITELSPEVVATVSANPLHPLAYPD